MTTQTLHYTAKWSDSQNDKRNRVQTSQAPIKRHSSKCQNKEIIKKKNKKKTSCIYMSSSSFESPNDCLLIAWLLCRNSSTELVPALVCLCVSARVTERVCVWNGMTAAKEWNNCAHSCRLKIPNAFIGLGPVCIQAMRLRFACNLFAIPWRFWIIF